MKSKNSKKHSMIGCRCPQQRRFSVDDTILGVGDLNCCFQFFPTVVKKGWVVVIYRCSKHNLKTVMIRAERKVTGRKFEGMLSFDKNGYLIGAA